MEVSIASSLLALLDKSAIMSACWSRCNLTTESRVKAGPVGSKLVPTASMRLAQWRGRMAGFLKSMISGMVFLKDSTMSYSEAQVSCIMYRHRYVAPGCGQGCKFTIELCSLFATL